MSKITNLRAKKSLSLKLENASTPFSRMRGLMFRKKCVPILFDFEGTGIWPIHSFFVAFDFDAIYLDEQMRVAEIFESVKPFQAYVSPSLPSRYLLELPPSSAKKLGARRGDAIKLG